MDPNVELTDLDEAIFDAFKHLDVAQHNSGVHFYDQPAASRGDSQSSFAGSNDLEFDVDEADLSARRGRSTSRPSPSHPSESQPRARSHRRSHSRISNSANNNPLGPRPLPPLPKEKMPASNVPKPGPAKLTRNADLQEWLEQALLCRYLPEPIMKQLCERVKECLMEGG